MGDRGRIAVVLMTVALGGLAAGAVADAKPKKKGKIVTRSATFSGTGNGTILTATATCPKKRRALSGGFVASPGTEAGVLLMYESQKVGQRSWRTSGQIFDPSSAGGTLSLTTHVYCRRGAPKTAAEAAVASSPAGAVRGPVAVARCPGKRKALAGGFGSVPPVTAGIPQLITDSVRGGDNGWFINVVSGPAAGTFASYAYCAKLKKAPKLVGVTSPPSSTSGAISTATASCAGKKRPLAGGFWQVTDPAATQFFYIHESQRLGRAWQVSGVVVNDTPPATIEARAYCG